MAEMDAALSLMSLEDELSCSICLNPFDCPVTIPCGHNFCQDCLLETWKGADFSCPQCRTLFATKPELRKNTVLSTVVETFNLRQSKSEVSLVVEEREAKKPDVILCDTCMEAEASRTCLTCMASYCEEHLRPHRENPKFTVHQLSEPVGDLMDWICSDHHKLMEFFCSQHGRPICSLCLQQVHKGCPFISLEEQRNVKETDLRDKLVVLDGKLERTGTVLFQMNDMQNKLKDAATKRKSAMAAVYQQMRDMLAQEEREAQHEVDHELEIGQTKLQDFMKRLTENTEDMGKARDNINSLLSQSRTLAFLQANSDLPKASKFDPYAPRVNLDSKKVMATQAFAAALKDHLTQLLKEPVEARPNMLKPVDKPGDRRDPPEREQSATYQPACPPAQPYFQPVPVPVYIGSQGGWNPHMAQRQAQSFNRPPTFTPRQKDQDKKAPNASGGHKPKAGKPDSPKKVYPKGHPSAGKKPGEHQRPAKK